jgi:plastocyanin
MIRKRLIGGFGVAAISLALAACGGSGTGSTDNNSTNTTASDSGSGANTVKVVSDANTVGAYQPADISVKVGDSVTWSFQDDQASHTATADDGTFDSSTLAKGQTYSFKFTKAGKVTYKCSLHPQMKGTVTVS